MLERRHAQVEPLDPDPERPEVALERESFLGLRTAREPVQVEVAHAPCLPRVSPLARAVTGGAARRCELRRHVDLLPHRRLRHGPRPHRARRSRRSSPPGPTLAHARLPGVHDTADRAPDGALLRRPRHRPRRARASGRCATRRRCRSSSCSTRSWTPATSSRSRSRSSSARASTARRSRSAAVRGDRRHRLALVWLIAAIIDADGRLGQRAARAPARRGARQRAASTRSGATDLTPRARRRRRRAHLAGAVLRRVGRGRAADRRSASSRSRSPPATPPGAFGIVEYVCRSAPTLGDALRQWVRYLNLLDDAVDVGLAIDGERAYLRVERESEAPAPASHELCFALRRAAARASCRRVPFRITAVEFAHRAPAMSAPYRAWFDAPVTFGAADARSSCCRAPRSTRRSSRRIPTLLAILTRAADELARAATRRSDADRAGHARARATRCAATRATSSDREAARPHARAACSAASRTRARRSDACARTSAASSRSATSTTSSSIAEISFLLGFSEPSAFFRAFKRWTGADPGRGAPPRQPHLAERRAVATAPRRRVRLPPPPSNSL